MKQTLLVAGLALILGAVAAPVRAHHGGAAYDQAQNLTFQGTVTELQFVNPHVLVYFDIKNKEGASENWSGWLTAPTKLARAGWSKNTLKPGDQITVSGSPHKGGNHILQIRKLVAPGGKDLPMFEN